ncbi:hypothetical protein KWG64_06255 [Rahnella sp. PD12R]|uniref:hypothetical protein n=1 Tax=Rahnella sp. PD12R TaxID=2855688 RepID=UPI001C4514E2|nr:hypothetical protein [Rahnella sp. PD12R]MBV6817542.1 hypothetical protein [Rahnella sp. PD12R]
MIEYFLWAIGFALITPAYMAFMSFVMWDNAFKFVGWGFVLRVTLVLEIILALAAVYKNLKGEA